MENTVETLSSQAMRDDLGPRVSQVHTSQRMMGLSLNGQPAGALVPPRAVELAGLDIKGWHAVTEARRTWADVRQKAIDRGPQAITGRNRTVAVLISADHARLIQHGLPVLGGVTELHLTEGSAVDQDGRPIPAGTWSWSGAVHVDPAPPEAPQKNPPASTTPTPD